MKESCRKGVANHPDPEPCEGGATQRPHLKRWKGAHVGWVSLKLMSSEIAKLERADGVRLTGRQYGTGESASTCPPYGVVDPRHAWKLHAREPRDPDVHPQPQRGGPVGEGDEL
jgi:hypothetical protein